VSGREEINYLREVKPRVFWKAENISLNKRLRLQGRTVSGKKNN